RISPEKGTAAGIRAARAATLRPLVIGSVYDPDYHRSAVAPLLEPGELLPLMRRELLWQVMAEAAVTLMPVKWEEPFGLVAAEVPGGSGGIGSAVMAELRRRGYEARSWSRRDGVDAADEAAVEAAATRLPRWDVLVNNAAVLIPGALAETSLADWEATLRGGL